MIRTNPKRSATHWRVALLFLGFLGSTELVSSAPANSELSKERTHSLSSPRKSSEQDIGSPSELAWQAWLLVDTQPGSNPGLDSASIVRRITPKSVFRAPQLEDCAEGYISDKLGRCQKIVKVDEQAHLDYLVQRLNQKNWNQKVASPLESTLKKQSPVVTGPLQLNIPLLSNVSKDESNSQVEEDEAPQRAIALETKKEESVVDYDARNKTKVTSNGGHEESFFLDSNSTVHKKNAQGASAPAFVAPVADFIDETNETFSGIMDYKIPLGLQAIVNRTFEQGKREEVDLTKEDKSTTEEESLIRDDDLTTLTSRDKVSEDNEESQESTTVTRDTGIENVTESPTRKEIISDGMVDIDSEMETWRNESDESPIQGTKKNETIEADVVYEEELEPDLVDQEEYSDTTQVSEEDSGESEDEILKHGETGMTIPIENQALIRSEKKKTTQAPKDDYSMETTTFFEVESDSITTIERGEDLGSNVSSEVSINKDFILETTLLDVNTGKVKNSTKPVSANSTASQQNRNDDLKALFEDEKKLITDPEVVFSPQDNRGLSVYGRKRDGQLLNTNFQSIKESRNSTTSEPPAAALKPLPHPARLRDHVARPIEEQASFHSERILPPDTKNKFPFRSPNLDPKPPGFESDRQIPGTNRRGGQDFVRFPNYERHRQDHVRFPSEDVNSIQSPEFMREQTSSNQNPILLTFWERMPLRRDPSFKTSPHKVKRVFFQNVRTPIGG